MNENEFWRIIDRSRSENPVDLEVQRERLKSALLRLNPADILTLDTILWGKTFGAYRWPLWGAAYLINGGCSDDGFEYFRRWLVSRGRKVYEAAIADPDSLAELKELAGEECEFEDFPYAVNSAYEERTGSNLPPADVEFPAEPVGECWDFDDDEETRTRLPRLAKRFS